MTSGKRIVVTGLGVVSPIGNCVDEFKKNLFAGVCGIGTIHHTLRGKDIVFPAAPILNFKAEEWIDPKKIPLQDRFSQLAVAAALQALRHAKLEMTPSVTESMGIITGTGAGGQSTTEESYIKLLQDTGSARVHPFTIPRLMANAASSHISMATGIRGAGFTVSSACASSLHAIGVAMALLRTGTIDRVITGGSESCLTLGSLRGWEALRVMAPDVCRPFSKDRAGMVIGEGAAMFVLESFESATERGATIYAELAGFGMSSDAKDITSPDTQGAIRAMRAALDDAHLLTKDIDYINAHGTGTRVNDISETAAIKEVFGDRAYKLAISSSKSTFGHGLGAAGALEMLATILALNENCAPATLNYLGPDPDCDLDYIPNHARKMPLRAALNNSFAFGGLNAVIAIKKTDAL